MKNQISIHQDNQVVLTDLTSNELIEINGGGFFIVAGAVIAAAAGLAYLYEFGYNMVDRSLAKRQQ